MSKMSSIKTVLTFNISSLAISLTEIEQYLQIGVLILSGLLSIIASIRNYKNGKKDKFPKR